MRTHLPSMLGFLSLLACQSGAWHPPLAPPPAPDRAAIVGGVLDGTTARPLPGALIHLLPNNPCGQGALASATADHHGSFTFADVIPGAYELQVVFIGYRRATVPITLTPGVADTIRLAVTPGPVACAHCRPAPSGRY